MLHPLGYKPDRPDHRDVLYRTSAPRAAAVPSEFTLENLCGEVGPIYQDKAGTCVLQVIAQACRVVWQDRYGMGKETPILSRRAGYYVARSLAGEQHDDVGCYPRFAFQALDDVGFCTEDVVPYEEDKINDPIPVSAYADSIDQEHVIRYKRLSDDIQCVQEMKESLALNRRPIGFAVQVTESFDNYSPRGVWYPGKDERNRGGHYLMAVGYSDRLGAVRVVNSWLGYGEVTAAGSLMWISYDFFADKLHSDPYSVYPSALPSRFNSNMVIL